MVRSGRKTRNHLRVDAEDEPVVALGREARGYKMKKPTNPLPSDIRYGGFLALPILAAFQGQSNVVTPSSLAFRVGLAEPLASWGQSTPFTRMGVC